MRSPSKSATVTPRRVKRPPVGSITTSSSTTNGPEWIRRWPALYATVAVAAPAATRISGRRGRNINPMVVSLVSDDTERSGAGHHPQGMKRPANGPLGLVRRSVPSRRTDLRQPERGRRSREEQDDGGA